MEKELIVSFVSISQLQLYSRWNCVTVNNIYIPGIGGRLHHSKARRRIHSCLHCTYHVHVGGFKGNQDVPPKVVLVRFNQGQYTQRWFWYVLIKVNPLQIFLVFSNQLNQLWFLFFKLNMINDAGCVQEWVTATNSLFCMKNTCISYVILICRENINFELKIASTMYHLGCQLILN